MILSFDDAPEDVKRLAFALMESVGSSVSDIAPGDAFICGAHVGLGRRGARYIDAVKWIVRYYESRMDIGPTTNRERASNLAQSISNIGFNWPAGANLSQAILLSIAQAFSPPNSLTKYTPNVNIGSNLKKADTQGGIYRNLASFASYLNEVSKQVGTPVYGDNYSGVQVTITGNRIDVFDGQGTQAPKLIQLAFQDLIGQPTWISPTQVSFGTVLRSDIACGMVVLFPQGIGAPYALTSTGAATGSPNAPASDKTSFQGQFYVNEVHHWANFRQPDGESWKTAFVATPFTPPRSAFSQID